MCGFPGHEHNCVVCVLCVKDANWAILEVSCRLEISLLSLSSVRRALQS